MSFVLFPLLSVVFLECLCMLMFKGLQGRRMKENIQAQPSKEE